MKRLRLNRLSVKLAAYTSLATFLISGLFLFISGWGAPSLAFFIAAMTLVVVYVAAARLMDPRLNAAREALVAMGNHNFEKLASISSDEKDELDGLNEQILRTGRRYEREITNLKQIENYRRKFVGNVSHELKTPIFSILGYSDTLLDGAIDDHDVRRGFVEKINRNAERLQNLARDLTEISRLESGEMGLVIELFDIREVLLEVVESLEPVAAAQGVTIRTGAATDLPHASGDAKRIRQVLVNLIDNAIKYTDRGGRVTVTVRQTNASEIRIAVKDTGIGIAEEHITRITERFFRVDQSRSRSLGGTGLGLAIVKHILAAHEETLDVKSAPSTGSTFSFKLRTADSAPETD